MARSGASLDVFKEQESAHAAEATKPAQNPNLTFLVIIGRMGVTESTKQVWTLGYETTFHYEILKVSAGSLGLIGAEMDRYLDCSARMGRCPALFSEIEDKGFKASMEREVEEWDVRDITKHSDALGFAYLSVLKKSRAEKVAANAAAGEAARKTSIVSEVDKAAQKKRDAVNEEIRRLESGEGDE